MNTVTITGNVSDEPIYGSTNAGSQYCRFAVAVSRKVRKDGSWVDSSTATSKWSPGTLAESCSKALIKGTRVQVSGSLQQHSWVSDDGTCNTAVEIVAEDVSLPLTRKKAEKAEASEAA